GRTNRAKSRGGRPLLLRSCGKRTATSLWHARFDEETTRRSYRLRYWRGLDHTPSRRYFRGSRTSVAVFAAPHRSQSRRGRSYSRHATFGRPYRPRKRKNRRRRDRISPHSLLAALPRRDRRDDRRNAEPWIATSRRFDPYLYALVEDEAKAVGGRNIMGQRSAFRQSPHRGVGQGWVLCRRQRTL